MNDKIMGRLAKGRRTDGPVSPMDAVSRALFFAGTGNVLPSSQPKAVDPIDQQLKMQRLQTGSPEFQQKLAQTKADVAAQQALDLEDMKRTRELDRARQAGMLADSQPTSNGSSFGIETTQDTIPSIANPQASPLGTMSVNNGPSFIKVPKSPATTKYDPKLGAMVNVPAEFGYELDPKYKSAQEAESNKMKKEGELQVKRDDFGKALKAFKAVGENIPRTFGAERFTQGAQNIKSRLMQEEGDPLASASATYEGARKNLRVAVARIKDVGNLSETEQKAAEMLVPSDMDSPEVYATKISYLEALAGVSNPDDIRRIIQESMSGTQPQLPQAPQTGGGLSDDQAYQEYLKMVGGN